MKPLDALIAADEPAMPLVRAWITEADVECEVLPPSPHRGDVLFDLQVTTRSALGAVAYETGGILVQGGWLRILGSGHARLPRRLDLWNRERASGYLLIADDAVGGFYALNGGALGADPGTVYYWAPDALDWEPLEVGYSELLQTLLTTHIDDFYESLRWPGWQHDLRALDGDRCYAFYPFLWTGQGSPHTSDRRAVPVAEVFDLKCECVRQLGASPG